MRKDAVGGGGGGGCESGVMSVDICAFSKVQVVLQNSVAEVCVLLAKLRLYFDLICGNEPYYNCRGTFFESRRLSWRGVGALP